MTLIINMSNEILNMGKVLTIVFLFLGSNLVDAQPYEKAPKLGESLHQIIEWARPDTKSDSKRGGTSVFDRKGRLSHFFIGQDSSDLQLFDYDAKGRLIEHIENSGDRVTQTLHVFKKDTEVKEIKFRDRIEKTFTFYKKGKKVESKTFVKGEELGDRLILKDRVIYSYDKRDSLKGEMHYAYPLRAKRKPQKRKTLYYYDEQSGRRSSVVNYDFDGNLRLRVDYQYQDNGKLSRIDYLYPEEGPDHFVEYKYQNGKLWQIIEESSFRKYVRIYKKDRLIRSRSYQDGSLIQIIDYQYVFY